MSPGCLFFVNMEFIFIFQKSGSFYKNYNLYEATVFRCVLFVSIITFVSFVTIFIPWPWLLFPVFRHPSHNLIIYSVWLLFITDWCCLLLEAFWVSFISNHGAHCYRVVCSCLLCGWMENVTCSIGRTFPGDTSFSRRGGDLHTTQ